LNEIKFFKREIDVNNYIGNKNLELEVKQNSIKQSKINGLINLFKGYFMGKDIDLIEKINEYNVELGLNEKFTTSFSRDVIKYVMKLKRGEILTYSEIGDMIGSKAYRAVGNVLRSNPLPLIIPCHRVIRKDGKIGGFSGITGESWETELKKNLLQIEGYEV